MKERVVLHVPYAVLCALNDLRLGICLADYIDWAFASGFKKSTAVTYWKKAKRMYNEEKYNHKELVVYPNL